jgi:hypothetical protein
MGQRSQSFMVLVVARREPQALGDPFLREDPVGRSILDPPASTHYRLDKGRSLMLRNSMAPP